MNSARMDKRFRGKRLSGNAKFADHVAALAKRGIALRSPPA
jgi:hypothetical protein